MTEEDSFTGDCASRREIAVIHIERWAAVEYAASAWHRADPKYYDCNHGIEIPPNPRCDM